MNEIIVGVDGSATARMAAVAAAELAAKFDRPLHIVMSMTRNTSQEIHGGGSERWHVDSIGVAEDLLKALAGELKTTSPVTHVSFSFDTWSHFDPCFQSDTFALPPQYWRVNSGLLMASHIFSGVERMYVV